MKMIKFKKKTNISMKNKLESKLKKINSPYVQLNLFDEISDFDNDDFDIRKFRRIENYREKIEYVQNKLEYINEGSSRAVYKIDDYYVFKLALNSRGIAQNKTEINVGKKSIFRYILASVVEHDPLGRWVISERAVPVTDKYIERATGGIEIYVIKKYIEYNVTENEQLFSQLSKYDKIAFKVLDKIVYLQMIIKLAKKYKLQPYDIINSRNLGRIHDRLVIIDYGLTQKIWDNMYL